MSKRSGAPQHRRAGEFDTIRQIRGANRAIGGSWFDTPAMRFFGTRVDRNVYGGRYFVTSEQDDDGVIWDGERRWTVRAAMDNGNVTTVGELGQYATREEAHAAARALAKGGK